MQNNASACGCEYVYAFSKTGDIMYVLSSYHNSAKMVGMFGQGDPNATWKVIGEVWLNEIEPNWERMNDPNNVVRNKNPSVEQEKINKRLKEIEEEIDQDEFIKKGGMDLYI